MHDLVVRREPGLKFSSVVCFWVNCIATSLVCISPLCDGNIHPYPAYSVNCQEDFSEPWAEDLLRDAEQGTLILFVGLDFTIC